MTRQLTKAKSPASRSGSRKEPVDFGRALIAAFLTSERMNQALLDVIDPKIWRQEPPCSKRRNIATTFAHIHNVRSMRIGIAKGKKPAKLDRSDVTPPQARAALSESAKALVSLIEQSLQQGGYVPVYHDVVTLVCGGIIHEAHHRGQIAHWARALGAPLTQEQQLKLWIDKN